MQSIAKETGVIQKTQELCQAIAAQADFLALKQKLDAFFGDEMLKFQFQQVNELGSLLRMKQESGRELEQGEVTQFEVMRDELMKNQAAVDFIDAQQELQKLHQMVDRFLDKTFELGRMPEYGDVHDGSCGNCGCH